MFSVLSMKNFYLLFLTLVAVSNLTAQSGAVLRVDSPANIAGILESTNAFANTWGGSIGLGRCVSGRLVLVTDGQQPDSIGNRGCNPLTNAAAVNGNIALVRRGDCFFSIKALKAQNAGAKAVVVFNRNPGEALLNMGAGDSSTFVTIPVFFVSFEDGTRLLNAMATGAVNVSMCNPAYYDATGAYAYATPQKEAKRLDSITVALGNGGLVRTSKVRLAVNIENPLGAVTVLRDSIDSIPAGITYRFRFDPYIFPNPAPIGKYKMTFTNSLTTDTLRSEFTISDYMFAIDNLAPNAGTTIDSLTYVNGSLRFDVGSLYYTGTNPDKCTHAAFALNNRNRFVNGDRFTLQLFKLDATNFGKLRAGTLTYDDLATSILAQKNYTLKSTDANNGLLVTEWDVPLTLDDNSIYLQMVRFDGVTSVLPTGIAPSYSYSGFTNYSNPATIVYAWDGTQHRFYSGGWANNNCNVVRLYMQGTRVGVERTTPALTQEQVKLFPNPVSQDEIQIALDLKNNADVLNVTVTDVLGKVVQTSKLYNVQNGTHPINISQLTTGTYFLTVVGKEGFRTVHFQVMK
jgi:hypothetical protein